jgi:ATP-binding cassette subfamily B protein
LDSLSGSDGPSTTALAVGVAAATVAVVCLNYVDQYVSAEFDRRVGVHARADLFDAVNRLTGLATLEDPRFHDRLQVAQHAAQIAPGRCVAALLSIAQAVLSTAGFIVALVILSPWLALAVAAATVLLFPVEVRLSRSRASRERVLSRIHRREGFYQGLLTRLDAAKEIRLFGLGGHFRDLMLTELRAANRLHRRLEQHQYAVRGVVAVLGTAVVGACLLWLIGQGPRADLTAGTVMLFLASALGVQSGVQTISSSIGHLNEMLLLIGDYEAVTAVGVDLPRHDAPSTAAAGRGIEFHDVWFRYGDDLPWVLRGAGFVLPEGRAVGMVGVNGAGKSTIVKLLCRFYDPTRGSITWDGIDLRAWDVEALRRRIGAVFQDFMDYDLTAEENIAVGDLGALRDPPRIVRAAEQAGIDAHLRALPRGYQTLLSRMFLSNADRDDHTTGVVLSGGQWQRIALARAFLRDGRDLLILDEPSSGLDAEAESELHHRLRRLRVGRACLLISHRLNAIRDADEILVVEDGRVVERGDHDQLVRLGGRYARMFELQASGYQEARA